MEPLRRLLNQLRTFWGGLSTVRRVLIVGAAAAVFVGLGAFAYLNQGGDTVPVFDHPLSEEEAAAITTTLKAQSIPYTLKDSHTVLVPKDRHAAARVALAAEGVPVRGGKGYELFDQSSLTTTPFVQNVNYQRALQSELSRSITQIEPVAAARVLIARPEPTPFVRDQRPPTASVVLKLKPNAALGRSQANSIVSLVSRSVDGLKPENVTVVDSAGRLLSDPHAGEKEDLDHGQIEYRRELERYLADKAQEVLTAHLGTGRAVVKVSADVNFQKVKERQERFSPSDKMPVAERLTTSKNSAAPPRGPAGMASNARPPTGGGAGGGSSSEEVIQTDYIVPKTVRELEDRMGAVTRLTVAALIDLTPPPTADGEPAPNPISAADAEGIIQNAIGFKQGRDSIKVTNVRLGGPPPPAEPDEEILRVQRMAAYVELARNVSLAVAVVMGLGVVGLLLLRRRRKGPATPTAVTPAATPEARSQELLARFLDTASSDPDRAAAAFGLLVGPVSG